MAGLADSARIRGDLARAYCASAACPLTHAHGGYCFRGNGAAEAMLASGVLARVRADALREAADSLLSEPHDQRDINTADWLRERADGLESVRSDETKETCRG